MMDDDASGRVSGRSGETGAARRPRASVSSRLDPAAAADAAAEVDGIRLGACVVDAGMRFVAIDDAFAEVLGRPAGDLIGERVGALFPGLEAIFGDSIREVLSTGEPIFGDSIREVHAAGAPIFAADASSVRDGVLRTTRAWFMPRRGGDGRVDGVSIVVADLAALRRADMLLQTFADLSARLAADEPTEEICRALLVRISASVGATWAAAIGHGPDGGEGPFVAGVGPGAESITERLRHAGPASLPITVALAKGRPIFVPRGRDAIAAFPSLAAMPVTVGAVCAVPGFSRGHASVAIGLVWEEEHAFDDREKHAITAVADLVAQAFDVGRLREEGAAARQRAEESADRTRRLRDLASTLAGAGTVDEVADALLAATADLLGADGACVFTHDPAHGIVRAVRASGSISRAAGAVDGSTVMGGSGTAAVIRAGHPVFFGSHEELERTDDLGSSRASLAGFMQAGAAIPLAAGGVVLGMFALAFDAPHDFGPDERAFLAAVGDVGGQALARAMSARREREMAALVDLAHDAMFVHDAAGTILAWNRGAQETYGWTHDEAVGASAPVLLASEFPAGQEGAIAALLANGAWEGEIVQRRRDGALLVMESRWSTLRLQDGTDAILEVGRDVTARRRAEDQARTDAQRTISALGVLPVSLFMFDRDLRLTWAQRRDRADGRPDGTADLGIAELLPAAEGTETLRAARHVLATGATVRLEVETAGPAGPRTIEYTLGPIRAADGHVEGVIAAGIDVTDRRREEQERRRMEAEVLEARRLESLAVIAGGIAHDFNNILAGIVGNAELALLDLPSHPDSVAQAIDDIRASAMRASELTRQLLAYAGQGRMATSRVDLTDLVAGMQESLRRAVPSTVDLRLVLAPGLPAIDGDAMQLTHVVANLVANSVDAIGDRPGTITVRTATVRVADADPIRDDAPTTVVLTVEDDGEGMDAATRDRMFEPFFTTRFTGRGLGLAAVLGIVQAHNGSIEVDSDTGHGTNVRVLFPAADPAPAASPSAPAGAASGHGRILVVDDEVEVRRVAARALERAGHAVEEVESGEAAIERLRTGGERPEVLVVDLTMPGMDGAATIHDARRIVPGIPAVVMSGYAPDVVAGRFGATEQVLFLQKPFAIGDLVGAVHRAIEAAPPPALVDSSLS